MLSSIKADDVSMAIKTHYELIQRFNNVALLCIEEEI